MSLKEEVDRYQKILEDWRPGSGAPAPSPGSAARGPVRTGSAAAMSRPTATVATVGEPVSPGELAAPGAILLIGERTLAIYQKAVPDKEYHLVQVLCPNGATKTQGLALHAHQFEEIGALPPNHFEQSQRAGTWDRDLIVFHCYRYEDVCRIPQPLGSGTASTETAPRSTDSAVDTPVATSPSVPAVSEQSTPDSLRRGQRLQIKFGANAWEAVYWGRDNQNHVVAHKTYQKWSLMHLDLERFANSLVADPVDDRLIAEIETSLLEG